jgi:DtxR family Mn-dependent transcriptional regulator
MTSAAAPPAPLLEALEAVFRLEREGTAPSAAALARRLGLGGAAACERVLALQGLGLLRAAGDRLTLTPEGERLALRQVRKHRLLERFLTDLLKLPWDRVHEEASRLSPALSDDVADALARALGDPLTCPHGNPIPAADGTLAAERAVPLHRLRPGQAGVILRIEREAPELLRYLSALGLLPDTRVEVEEAAPLGGPILVRCGEARYALGRKVAARILVREV